MSVSRAMAITAAVLAIACGHGNGRGARLDCPTGTKAADTGFARGCKRPDGTWHGPFASVHEGGKPHRTGTYRDGVPEGRWTLYAQDGRLLGSFEIIDGNGVMLDWSDSGQKISETPYRAGKIDGVATTWYPDGRKSSEAVLREGFQEGVTTHWNASGTKISEQSFRHGRLHGVARTWDPATGAPVQEREHDNGYVIRETNYKDGVASTRSYPPPEEPRNIHATTHPSIDPAWQICQEHADCELVTLTCCACGANNYAGVHYKHAQAAHKAVQPDCEKTECPAMHCNLVLARCHQGRCASAE